MKNLICLPLLFLGITKATAQFNTASYQNKIASVDVSEFSENHFSGTFMTYHIEGKSNKKAIKEAKKKEKQAKEEAEKINRESEANLQTIAMETPKDLPTEVPLENEKIIKYKRLEKLADEEVEIRQLVYMPLSNMTITSHYGTRFHPIDKVYKEHNGIDLRADESLVYSVLDGIVSEAGYSTAAGNYMKIKHESFETIYLHLEKFYYTKGDIIKAGDIIALSGNTGKSTAPHLHFAVKEDGNYINPITFLNSLITTNNALIDYENGTDEFTD